MRRPDDVTDLAERLIAEATSHAKTAAAAPAARPATLQPHPIADLLRKTAAVLRDAPEGASLPLELVEKIAAATDAGTGAQSPAAGASVGASMASPTLPALKTENLGARAGGGGVGPRLPKLAAELRSAAEHLRQADAQTKQAQEEEAQLVLSAAQTFHRLQMGPQSP